MEISIVREASEDLRLYVACSLKKRDLAVDVQRLFNETIGGFEFCDPVQQGDRWTTRTLCQLHLKEDGDRTDGDRGNSVVHALGRVCMAFAGKESDAVQIVPPGGDVAAAARFAVVLGTLAPHLHDLPRLLEMLNEPENLHPWTLVHNMLMDSAGWELPADYQEVLAAGAYHSFWKSVMIDDPPKSKNQPIVNQLTNDALKPKEPLKSPRRTVQPGATPTLLAATLVLLLTVTLLIGGHRLFQLKR